jgi:8-oxo-dGTP diphosphatase
MRGPRVGVSAIVIRDGALLLTRRRGAHGAMTWSPPGGHVEAGEAPDRAVVREPKLIASGWRPGSGGMSGRA